MLLVVFFKKVVLCFIEEIRVLGEFYVGTRYSVVGREFNVIELTIYIIERVFK